MNELTHLSLFTGFGGLDLAAEWAGFRTVGQCEWANYPNKVLQKHWPNTPRWKDIRTLTGDDFYERTSLRTVDIISGGFPCQPFSVAGKQRGKEDDRYLWPEMVRVIKELRPTWVVGENVAGIVRMALPEILNELEGCGYCTRTFLIPAAGVGARHRRNRVAVVGWNTNSNGWEYWIGENGKDVADTQSNIKRGLPGREKQENPGFGGGSEDVQHTNGTGCEEFHVTREPDKQGFPSRGCNEGNNNGERTPEYGPGEWWAVKPGMGMLADGISSGMGGCIDMDFLINHYWDTEPDIPRVAIGVKDRVEKLKGFGNAVVPQQFYPIFRDIREIEYLIKTEQLQYR